MTQKAKGSVKRVTDQTKKSERQYDAQYRIYLELLGAKVYKIEPKHYRGWPDIYVAPNIYLECKYIRWYTRAGIRIGTYLEPLQSFTLRQLREGGCKCYVVVFWDFGPLGEHVQTIDYDDFCHLDKVDKDQMLGLSQPISEIQDHVESIFRVAYNGEGQRACAEKIGVTKTRIRPS